jgi:hypothetical protein
MKRKLIEVDTDEIHKKARKSIKKRSREHVIWNCSGASSDEDDEERPLKKGINTVKRCIPFKKINLELIPTYIN